MRHLLSRPENRMDVHVSYVSMDSSPEDLVGLQGIFQTRNVTSLLLDNMFSLDEDDLKMLLDAVPYNSLQTLGCRGIILG